MVKSAFAAVAIAVVPGVGGHRSARDSHRNCESRARRTAGRSGCRPDAVRAHQRQVLRRAGSDRPEERAHHRHPARAAQRARQGRVRRHVLDDEADRPVEGERRADVFRRQSGQRSGFGEPGRTHLARQRLAGRRRADGQQPDDSSAAREESGRQQHHRTARHPHPWPERHHRGADRFRAATPSPYPPATLDTTKATLVSAVSESATGVKSGRGEDCEHRLGVRDVREDAVSRNAGSGAHLPEERLQPVAAVRAAVHGEGSARARHRVRGHARYQFVLPLREERRRGHAESCCGQRALGDLRGQLAIGHLPARVHPARLQSGRKRRASCGRAAIRTSPRACST